MPQTSNGTNQLPHVLPASFSALASPWGFPSPFPQIPPAMYQFMQQWGMPSHMNSFMPPTPMLPSPTTIHQIDPSIPNGNIGMMDAVAVLRLSSYLCATRLSLLARFPYVY